MPKITKLCRHKFLANEEQFERQKWGVGKKKKIKKKTMTVWNHSLWILCRIKQCKQLLRGKCESNIEHVWNLRIEKGVLKYYILYILKITYILKNNMSSLNINIGKEKNGIERCKNRLFICRILWQVWWRVFYLKKSPWAFIMDTW